MQVPSSITLNNGSQKNQSIYNIPETSTQFNMDVPDKLTGKLNFIFLIAIIN